MLSSRRVDRLILHPQTKPQILNNSRSCLSPRFRNALCLRVQTRTCHNARPIIVYYRCKHHPLRPHWCHQSWFFCGNHNQPLCECKSSSVTWEHRFWPENGATRDEPCSHSPLVGKDFLPNLIHFIRLTIRLRISSISGQKSLSQSLLTVRDSSENGSKRNLFVENLIHSNAFHAAKQIAFPNVMQTVI